VSRFGSNPSISRMVLSVVLQVSEWCRCLAAVVTAIRSPDGRGKFEPGCMHASVVSLWGGDAERASVWLDYRGASTGHGVSSHVRVGYTDCSLAV
jgi:hypothetical protein